MVGTGGVRWREGEFELTCVADARLLGGNCAREVVAEGPLRLVRLDGRGLASRPAHVEVKSRVMWRGAQSGEDSVSSNLTICGTIKYA